MSIKRISRKRIAIPVVATTDEEPLSTRTDQHLEVRTGGNVEIKASPVVMTNSSSGTREDSRVETKFGV